MSGARDLLYRPAAGRLALGPVARWGYRRYLAADQTPRAAYVAMRKLYGNGSGAGFADLVARAEREHPRLDLPADPAGLAAGQVDDIVGAVRRDGYVVLDRRLGPDACDALEAVARTVPCDLVEPLVDDAPARAVYDPAAPVAVRYEVPEADAVAAPAAQRIIADESLLAVAQAYLGAAPVQDLVTMWWSVAAARPASSRAAQQFHFDLDRLRFLKVFVFLTDVDEDTGPHVYVAGSHRATPPGLRRDGRHGDAEVEAAFPGAVRTIAGSRGTVFLADTVGLHKGRALERGHRLVFQTEYATSLFGAPYTSPAVAAPTPELAAMAQRHPSAFRRFRLSGPGSAGG